MCGISGIWALKTRPSTQQLEAVARDMAERLLHRGPDDGGVWADAQQAIALSHRRLSILDLSAHGHQPMQSVSGRYVLSYNGEIYNYKELKRQLDYPWQGGSDTEVLLAAIECWGLEKTLQQLNGMFALALWDKLNKTLSLARDKMGEKPLYYGVHNGDVLFASELKAFKAVPNFSPKIDRTALTQFVRYSYVPAPRSIYEGISKLPPAHYVVFDSVGAAQPKPYWSMVEMVAEQSVSRRHESEETLTDELEVLLKEAVGLRMVADVPLGAFLSGGIDSSTIVALMQAQSSRPVKTFSIGFAEGGFDEAPYAKAVAQHLGTDHTELYVSAADALAVIPKLPHMYDEPFADASQVPTYLVSQLARSQVTVSLSGDGGDEFFGGYNRYVKGAQIWRYASLLPQPLRSIIASGFVLPILALALPTGVGSGSLMQVEQVTRKLKAADGAAFYRALCSQHLQPQQLVQAGDDEALPQWQVGGFSDAEWMMLQDAHTYLPNDILTKVDRAAMAVSLETRIPFFDPKVMAFAWSLPEAMKIHEGKGKHLLRQVLYRYVPRPLIDRPKAGFAMPLPSWLRGELKDWAADLLAPQKLQAQGYLDASQLQQLWTQHQSARHDHSGVLWNVLMFQSWLEQQGNA